jgi:hypothetical protein
MSKYDEMNYLESYNWHLKAELISQIMGKKFLFTEIEFQNKLQKLSFKCLIETGPQISPCSESHIKTFHRVFMKNLFIACNVPIDNALIRYFTEYLVGSALKSSIRN